VAYPGRILIVEDDADFADSLVELLEDDGYQVRVARAAGEVLSVLEDFEAQIALLDIRLGRESGLALIPELREIRPDLVCIVMTAFADLETAVEAVRQGAYDYLRKPFDTIALELVLQRAFKNLQLQEELSRAQRLETVGRLSAGVAHDFNNILTSILGEVGMLRFQLDKSPELSEEALRTGLDQIDGSARHAAVLTKQLLIFSRQQATHPEVVDLNEVLLGLRRMLIRFIREDIDVDLSLGPGSPSILIDLALLKQVIINLVVNAGDAMTEGGSLIIETETEPEGTGSESSGTSATARVLLRVSDTGCGIDSSFRDHIFDPFFTTKEVGEGTGLGLAMVHGIARAAGGGVRVESEPGQGTKVEVWFPLIAATPGEVAPEPAADFHEGGTETILLCEDERAVRDVLRAQLVAVGYHVLEAQSPAQALTLAESFEGDIDLLLTDMVMPGMQGTELAARLRENREGTRVLFISGHPKVGPGEDWLGDGRCGFLRKPLQAPVLLRELRELLDRDTAAQGDG
jgi:two-component system, cell cycle sensor histidine kinase and response regulator CckA